MKTGEGSRIDFFGGRSTCAVLLEVLASTSILAVIEPYIRSSRSRNASTERR
jgi:hypothetical protein